MKLQNSPEKLQKIMSEKCIGVNALSRKSGVSKPTIIRYSKTVAPNQSLRIIGLIAKGLEVDVSEITNVVL